MPEERPLKIAYLSGPANTRQIYREWLGQKQQDYFGTDYMKQFLQLASDHSAASHVISWYGSKRETFRLGDFTFDNRPITSASGLRYYADQLVWNLGVLFTLIRFRPDLLLLTGNQNFWWLLSPLRLFGTKIIPSYHAVLWPKLLRPNFALRSMVKLNGLLILRHAAAIVVTSKDIRRQVEKVLGKARNRATILEHLPSYSPLQFADIRAPDSPAQRPFRTMFLGRMVPNKGIYDIVEIARELEKDHPGQYRFDLCGDGSELDRLRNQVSCLNLEEVVHCHGFCGQGQVLPLLNAAHVCIVPTRADCEAGFEMTCAESILAGRPLITSAVCPALEYVGEAVVEASANDPDSYREAIVRLSSDPHLYERKRRASIGLQEQFYDPANSWYAAMKEVLERQTSSTHRQVAVA
jgi:glycogen synthase